METTQLQFIYVYDALCGWCYGFSPVVKDLYQKFNEKIHFEVIAGGMVMGEQAGPVGDKAAYLLQAYPSVEERTDVRFGPEWVKTVEEGSVIYDSYPSAVALEVFKDLNKDLAVPFAAAIQNAIYKEGKAPAAMSTFLEIADQLGEEPSEFKKRFALEKFHDRAKSNFMYTKQLNVQGFPAVFLRNGDQYWMIAKGYRPTDHMLPLVERFIEDKTL